MFRGRVGLGLELFKSTVTLVLGLNIGRVNSFRDSFSVLLCTQHAGQERRLNTFHIQHLPYPGSGHILAG